MTPRPDNRGGPLGAGATAAPPAPRFRTFKRDVNVGAGQHLGFAKGRGYYPAPGAPAAPPSSPTSAINRIAGYSDPLEAQAYALVNPLVESITNRIGAATKAGAGAITGYANELANALGPFEKSAGDIYGQAEQSQAAADAALSSALRGGGSALADQLSGKLALIGAPNAAATTGAVASTGSGAANALLGTGSASLGQLIAEGAHAKEFASKLPVFAREQGLSDLRDLELAQQAKLYDQTQQVESQIPSIVGQLSSAAEQRREFDVSTRQKALLAQMASETDQAKLAQDWQKFQSLQAHEDARATMAQQGQNDRAAASNAIRWYNAETSRWRSQHPTATSQQASTAARARWVKMAEDFYHGVAPTQHYDSTRGQFVTVPGTGQGPVQYGTALRILMSAGATRAVALQILNSLYQPGEGGRPSQADIANARARRTGGSSGLGLQVVPAP